MASPALPKFEAFTDPETLGPRWKRWLEAFGYFADTKWLLDDTAVNAVQIRTQRRSALLHYAGQEVQEIFSTL